MIHGDRERATRDIQKMFCAGGDKKIFSSIPFSLRKRLPGLHVNLATDFMAAAVVVWVWYGKFNLGLVIGLGMLLNLFFDGLAGASMPLPMRRLGLDPAQSSNIILTTVTDGMGFMAFLSLAVIFEQFLL
ncbi:MAG: magnesium transporter [Deltaproteobacteria bacterium]|jgi:Mg/Co/Ni transporter MgtE|nr:magnesium transporter [Deltaproteobacteria bacterium]